jgi:hypothetical protein
MQPFNPMLTLTSAAQMVLSPGGLVGLTSRSFRMMKRQVRVLGEVGEKLVEGTTEAIRATLPGEPPENPHRKRPDRGQDGQA